MKITFVEREGMRSGATYEDKPHGRNPESKGDDFENKHSPNAGIAPEKEPEDLE